MAQWYTGGDVLQRMEYDLGVEAIRLDAGDPRS